MELHQLRYFVAVAEEGGFSRAAVRCGVAQPSLSQQVKKLETTLGTDLFDRLGRSTILTEAGQALLPKARAILAQVRSIQDESQAMADNAPGRLRIGAIPTIAPYVLPKAVASLLAQRPGCEVSIREDVTDRLIRPLVDAELDVCLLSTPIDHDLIEVRPVAVEPLCVAVPKGHAWASRRSVPIAALDEQPLIVLHEEHCFGRQLSALCSGARVCPAVKSMSAQLRTCLELVAAGIGVTVVPAMCAAGSKGVNCVFVPLVGASMGREIALAWRKDRSKSAAAMCFASVVQDHFAAPRA